MKQITYSFSGASYMFSRAEKALKRTLDELEIKYTLENTGTEQILTIDIEQLRDYEIFALGMLIMQTILLNK